MNYFWAPNTDYGASYIRGAQNNRAQDEFAAQRETSQATQALRERQFNALQDYRQKQMDLAAQLRAQRAEALKQLIQETGQPSVTAPAPSAGDLRTPQPPKVSADTQSPLPSTTGEAPQLQSSAEGEANEDSPQSAADALQSAAPVVQRSDSGTMSAADALKTPSLPDLTTAPVAAPQPVPVAPSVSPADVLRRKQRLIALGSMAGLPASSITALAREAVQKPITTAPGAVTTFPDGSRFTNSIALPKPYWANVNGVVTSNGVPVYTNLPSHVLSPGAVLQQGTNTVASNPKVEKPEVDLQAKETEKILSEQVKSLTKDFQGAQSKDKPEIQRQIARINLKRQQLFTKPSKSAAGPSPGASNDKPQTVSSQEEYDALPKGSFYVDSAGNVGQKK